MFVRTSAFWSPKPHGESEAVSSGLHGQTAACEGWARSACTHPLQFSNLTQKKKTTGSVGLVAASKAEVKP